MQTTCRSGLDRRFQACLDTLSLFAYQRRFATVTISEAAAGLALRRCRPEPARSQRTAARDGWMIGLIGREPATKPLRDALQKSAFARLTTVLGPGIRQLHMGHLHLDMSQRPRRHDLPVDRRVTPGFGGRGNALARRRLKKCHMRRRLFREAKMPAKSAAQQKAAGAALAAKRGEIEKSELRGASLSMAKSMTEAELDELASTKRKGKPEHVSTS
ncbi:MAG: hypothetical protein DCF30_03825 [Hyphomicrobiales bacterium]|nr:MAG: hypothetical protein DCF30_03825 [Hyphomicrobiales bacterium]